MRTFVDDRCRERDVRGDDEIVGADLLGDMAVSDVEASCHLREANVGGGRHTHRLIGNQRHLHAPPLGGAKQNFLDDTRTGVGIDPDLHAALTETFE